MTVIPLRAEGKPEAKSNAYSPRGPVLIATTNPVLVEGIRASLPNLLTFSSGRDVVDTVVNDGGYRALFVDFVPLQDSMTGMGLLRALRERGVTGLPIWLLADSWPAAQDIWAKEKLGSRGYCLRNAGAILNCIGKKVQSPVGESVNPPIAGLDISEAARGALSAAFRRFAGPAAEFHLNEVLGNSDNRGIATSMDTAIQLLAERLTIAARRTSFADSVADLKKK